MLVRKYVILVALAIAALFTFLSNGKAACADAAYLAWAAEENGSAPGTPVAQQEVRTAPTNSSLQAQPGESGSGTQQELQTAPTSSPPAPKPEESGPGMQHELQSAPTSSSPPPKPEESRQETTFVDVLHGKMSEKLLTTAAWMDSFFADENYVKEVNRSYVRFRYDMFKEDGFPATLKPAVDLRLSLPQLERRTHLVFAAEPTSPVTGPNAPVKTAAERFGTTEAAHLTTALQYFFRTTPRENAQIMTGLQLSKFQPVLFISPRYRALFPYAVWQLRFTQELLWRTDTAWQTDSRFELERQLKDLFFRTTLDGVWASRTMGYFYSLSFLLREPFGPNHAVDYEWINNYQTLPVNELTEIDFRIRYRHNFWREWLFFEVAPQMRFPRDHNFDRIPGILFRLELFFGRNPG